MTTRNHHDVAWQAWDETQDIANVAEAVFQYLRSLPVEQRMEAMGMERLAPIKGERQEMWREKR